MSRRPQVNWENECPKENLEEGRMEPGTKTEEAMTDIQMK